MSTRFAPALLLTLTLLCGGVRADDKAPAVVKPDAASFDKRYVEIDTGDFVLEGPEHGQRLLDELKALLPEGDAKRLRMYHAMQCSLSFDDDYRAGFAFAQEHVKEAKAANDQDALARLYFCMAGYMGSVQSNKDTLATYEAGLNAARATGDTLLVAYGMTYRGSTYSLLGEQAAALIDFLEAQKLFKALKRETDIQDNVFNIAVAYRRMGEFSKAAEYLKEYQKIVEAKNDRYSLISVLLQRGYLGEESNRYDDAEKAFDQALALSYELKNNYDIAMAKTALANTYIFTGRAKQAIKALDAAQAEFDRLADQSNAAIITLHRGEAYVALGQPEQALAYFDKAEKLLHKEGNLRYLITLHQARSNALEDLGQYKEALAELRQYLQVNQTVLSKMRSEQTVLLRHQFDAQQRDLENAKLNADKLLREQEVESLKQSRKWQWAFIATGSLLLVLLSILAVRQVLRLRRLQVLALTDALTGVANRRRIERIADEQITEAIAQKRPFAILTLDVDFFKRINDTHGHLAGDQVLTRVANVCQAALREFDVIGRTGGEEFLVVLPRAQVAQAAQVAERLRVSVEELELEDIAPGLKVTISLGVAEFRPEDRDLKGLMRRADNGLYRAKGNGRNRIEIES